MEHCKMLNISKTVMKVVFEHAAYQFHFLLIVLKIGTFLTITFIAIDNVPGPGLPKISGADFTLYRPTTNPG